MLVDRGIVAQPRALRGAWAGEIGQTQLMPSAYLMYATTPDGSGTPDLIHNSADALASTAAFLKGHGWQPGAGWNEGEPNFAAILHMELGGDLRKDSRAVRRPAGGEISRRTHWRDRAKSAPVGAGRWNMLLHAQEARE